jgi:hypothetical protein
MYNLFSKLGKGDKTRTQLEKERTTKNPVAQPKHELKFTKTGIALNRNGAPMIDSPFNKHIKVTRFKRILGYTKSY